MFRILIADRLELGGQVPNLGADIEIVDRAGIDGAELGKIVGEFDALIVRSRTKVTREMLASPGRLRAIGRAGTGVDNIDVDHATKKGIVVMNVPGGNSNSAAEHTIALMMSMARNIPAAQRSLMSGKWEPAKFVGVEVSQKTLGVIGLGKIGLLVAEKARGLGMRVVGFDPVTAPEVAQKNKIEFLPLEDAIRASDFVTVHVPLAPSTKHLINAELLAKAKPGMRLINCARGGIIDEAAVNEALKAGRLGGLALDVFETEPPGQSPLFESERLVATPHLGASTIEAQETVSRSILEQTANYFHGKGAAGAVNGWMMDAPSREALAPYLDLAERLGKVLSAMERGAGRLQARYYGGLVCPHARALTAHFLKGYLARALGSDVNEISALALAKEHGMTLEESTREDHRSFQTLIYFTIERDGRRHEIAGTVFGKASRRMVRLERHNLDAIPEGYLLIVQNRDTPGIVGKVGTLLGDASVNIAQMSLGRDSDEGLAMAVISLDSKPTSGVLAAIRGIPDVVSVDLVQLD